MKESHSSLNAHPLIRKMRQTTGPIANLIGFTVGEIGDGRAVGSLGTGPQHANSMDLARCR